MNVNNMCKKYIKKFVMSITKRYPEFRSSIVEAHRRSISEIIKKHHDGVVAYGPFKGLKLTNDAYWGFNDHGAMILGLYEQEILNELEGISPQKKVFIDLGAADGYYGIGVLVGHLFERSYCYEMSEKGREVIARNALINNVHDKIFIRGEAKKNFYDEIDDTDMNNSVLLVDIEGGEFEVIDKNTFKAFSRSIIIIEIHEFYDDSDVKLHAMKMNSEKTHTIKEITTSSRDLSKCEELRHYDDSSRWLLCSERRSYRMKWLRFDPI